MSSFHFYLHGLQRGSNPRPPDYQADVLLPDHNAPQNSYISSGIEQTKYRPHPNERISSTSLNK